MYCITSPLCTQAPGSPSISNRLAWNIVVNIDTQTISTRPTRGRYILYLLLAGLILFRIAIGCSEPLVPCYWLGSRVFCDLLLVGEYRRLFAICWFRYFLLATDGSRFMLS